MKDIVWLKEEYIFFLQGKQDNLKCIIKDLQQEGSMDEIALEKIKLNVVEIFSKMFNISLSDDPIALKEKYFGFFDKIAKPWCVNKEEALKFGEEKEAIIEDIKIQEADELKSKFEEYYNQIDIS